MPTKPSNKPSPNGTLHTVEKARTPEADKQTVQQQPNYPLGFFPGAGFEGALISIASVADSFTPWGTDIRRRDYEIRTFVPTEPTLASALYNVTIRNVSFSWTLEGPPRTVARYQDMLHMADLGGGWLNFITKICQDLFECDNGAFIEIIREADSEDSPVVGLAALDSLRCTRTGDRDEPVRYMDMKHTWHKMKWYQVIPLTDFISPFASLYGIQLSAVSRILRTAQILRDISIYKREKIGGYNPSAVHFVSNLRSTNVEDAMQQHRDNQTLKGMQRYVLPLVMGSLDPSRPIDVKTIDIRGLPDGFDEEVAMKWYINTLALGFGADYQDFAPLPGGNLGTSAQSEVLHQKSRGKGPAHFMKLIEYALNFYGVLPNNVTFRYDEQDKEADTQQAQKDKTRADTFAVYVTSGILNKSSALQMMLDEGIISEEVFTAEQQAVDLTEDVTLEDEEQPDAPENKPSGIVTDREQSPTDNAGQKAAVVEEVSDFAERERRRLEADMQSRVEAAFARVLALARAKITGKKSRWIVGTKVGPQDILDDPAFWEFFRMQMIGAFMPSARDTMLEAAVFNQNLGLSINMDLVNQRVLELTREYTNTWWGDLQTVTRGNLREAIATWQETGLGNEGLPDLVRMIEPMFGTRRAEMIASTETTRLFNEGNKLAYAEAGIENSEFQTARDSHVCMICEPFDGQRFPINEGPQPPLHVRCRCARIPVANDGKVIEG